jgi:type IV pilus assembly protein PilQ
MVAAFAFIALPAAASSIKNLQFSSLPGGQIEIVLSLDGPPPQPTAYTIEKPANIALDLSGVKNGLPNKYHNLGVGNARSITLMETKDRTRIIVNLTELVPYTSKIVGNDLIVTVGRDATKKLVDQSVESKGVDLVGVTDKRQKKTTSSIKQVDFRRGPDADGQIIISLSDPSASVDMREQGGKIFVEFANVDLPESLRRRLDVVDFATPVKSVDASMVENKAVIQINPTGRYEYLAYQADNNFTVSVKPLTEEDQAKKNKDNFLYTGEKLSLNFQDIEVRNVLQLIADFTGLNLVASDTVSGNITLRLQNVPWDQALDLILKTKGLDKRKVGNVMLVAPADEIAAREKLELEASKQVLELAPIRSEYIQINYAKAKDLAGLMESKGGSGVLSTRGSVIVDERTNTLLVNDTAGKIDEVRRMLAKLDIPVKQVLIESRVVVANKNFGKDLGVKWGGLGQAHTNYVRDANGEIIGVNKGIFGGGSLTSTQNHWDSLDGDTLVHTNPDDLVVDLGVSKTGASSLALGYFSNKTGLLELELSALESDGKADIIATPKVLTADQQTARIASGTEIPYQEASSSGATSVSFKEAVLSLEVTPQITPDGRIIMDLKVNQDTVGKLFGPNGIPSIDTNEIKTSVLVDDGETVVLGGVFRNQSVESTVKTPFFGDLPVVGRLFKNTSRTDEKQELLVFITPKIVKNVMAQQ